MNQIAQGSHTHDGRIDGRFHALGRARRRHPDRARGDLLWRVLFFFGLLTGGLVTLWWWPAALDIRIDVSTPAVILAGLLVGLGARIGSGCTSGHGVCGVGRLAPRSIVASAAFVSTAMLTVYVVRHVLGGI
ncbi:MAG: YeeE/YedE thiosulfate transporter family protein [Sulfuricaulis sp.]|nr:YeeE/YedE thiosulfate transporter family protein [Sulfuricaulis sp.]MCR4347698.1 YeeE/YedE thiosulfate transporter family protein [Sulfuricaulis sp.]